MYNNLNQIFKRIDKPIEGVVQGNVFVIQRIKSGILYLKDENDNEFSFEAPMNLMVAVTIMEATGLSGPAEFCQCSNGNYSIDWISEDSTSTIAEFDCEDDGRWIARIPNMSGMSVYGATKDEAARNLQKLALETLDLEFEFE